MIPDFPHNIRITHRDHPFKTSANFSRFLTPTTVGSFLLLSVGKFGKILTPPPLLKGCRRLKRGRPTATSTKFPQFWPHILVLAWSNEQLWIKNAIFSRKVIGKMASTNALLWMRLKVCDFQKLWHFSSLSTMWLLCTIHGLKKFLIQLWRISQPGNSFITSFLNPWILTYLLNLNFCSIYKALYSNNALIPIDRKIKKSEKYK